MTHDTMYYFHVSATQIKEWLSELPAQSTECAGKTYYFIENPTPCHTDCHAGIPKCIFLAGFDQLMMA